MEPAASWAGQECDVGDMGESHSMLRRPARGRYAVATGCCFVLFGLIHCVRFELCFVSCFPVLAMSCLCALACSLVSGRTSSETADGVREPFFACAQGRAKRKRVRVSLRLATKRRCCYSSNKQLLGVTIACGGPEPGWIGRAWICPVSSFGTPRLDDGGLRGAAIPREAESRIAA